MAQHGHLVRHGKGLVLVVGDEDGRGPGPAQHVVHLAAHAGAQAGVERGERLVEQDDLGIGGQGAGERHALLLAARELVGIAPVQSRQSDHLEQLEDPLAPVGAAPQPEGDVATDGEVREQRALLGHIADATVLARDEHVAAVVDQVLAELDLAAIEALEAGDDAQQRRLAAARRAQNAGETAGLDGQVHAVEDLEVSERLAHASDGELLHRPIVAAGSTSGAVPVKTVGGPAAPAAAVRAGSRSNQRPST